MSNWLRSMNISTRLMFIIIGFNIVTLFLICLVAISSNQLSLERQLRDRFVAENQEVTQIITADLQEIQTIGTQLSDELGTLTTYSYAEIINLARNIVPAGFDNLIERVSVYRPQTDQEDASVVVLEEFLPNFSFVNSVRIFTADNQLPATSSPMLDALSQNQPVWFVQKDNAYAAKNYEGAISLALPYRYIEGQMGVIWLDIPLSTFNDIVNIEVNRAAIMTEADTSFVVLVSHDGQVLSRVSQQSTDITEEVIQDILDQTASGLAPDGLSEVRDPLTGQKAFVSQSNIEMLNWQLVSLLPRSSIPAPSATLAMQLIVLSSSGIVLMILAINYFTGRSIVEPLMNLSHAAQEIGSGDLRYHIDYRGFDDEIGFLARAMEGMKGNIAHSYNELRTWSRTLEERVYDRTRELNATRKEAEQIASDLRAVYDESLMVVNEPTLEPILEKLAHRILSLLSASYCSVWLLDDSKENVRLVTNTHETDIDEFIMPADKGMVGSAIQEHHVIVIDDYIHYDNRVSLPFKTQNPYVRAMVAPMMFDGNPMGALVVGRQAKGKPFTESDTRMLTLFSNLVSPAVRNAQLFNQREAARREAERANQVKTRFLASVTHELRTPLNLVINNMDFMRIGAFGEVSDEQVSRLNQTVRSAEHLLYLINDLLDVSKIEAGEMQLFIQPNDLTPIIEDSVDTTYALMEKIDGKSEKVNLVVDVEENLPKIPMDSRRIRQVLTNLLSNAVKFTHEGNVTLNVKRMDTGIYFAVSDTGIGIPEHEKDVLFEAFERTTTAKEQAIEGTGLGLPISQFLVQQHGGEIDVESIENEGTTFMFTLPFETPPDDNTSSHSAVLSTTKVD